MREIEIKVRLRDMEALEQKLREKGVVLSTPIHQHDTVYSKNGTAEFESAKQGDIILRIRRQDDGVKFTLKQQCGDREMDNIEHETQVADPDILQEILKLLGWLPEMDVKKVRRTGHIGEYEICLDQVEELGDFVELEKLTGDDVDPEIVREELFKALEELGLSREDEETRGYDTQIYHLHKKTLS